MHRPYALHAPALAALVLAASVLTALPGAVLAQPPAPGTAWADPTRPAGALAAESGASAPRAARAPSAASAPAPVSPQLQSVQVGPTGQTSALVDGRVLQAGDALGSARIVAIDADGLTLRDAKGRTERLLLLSQAIAKRDGNPPQPQAAAPSPARPVAALSTGAAGAPGREGKRP